MWLPWWRSGWESACQCRGHGFDPWSGKIPHATERLSPCATTAEPVRLEPVHCSKRGHHNEKLACSNEDPTTAKNKKIKINKFKKKKEKEKISTHGGWLPYRTAETQGISITAENSIGQCWCKSFLKFDPNKNILKKLIKIRLGLPWWRSGWESACQCRGHGFEPWSGKIPHATELLSLCATTTELACHNYWSLHA